MTKEERAVIKAAMARFEDWAGHEPDLLKAHLKGNEAAARELPHWPEKSVRMAGDLIRACAGLKRVTTVSKRSARPRAKAK
jgi:hypothetical protein